MAIQIPIATLAVASYTKGTTGTGTQINGAFAVSYIGNLSA